MNLNSNHHTNPTFWDGLCKSLNLDDALFGVMEKKHPYKKWDVSISKYETPTGKVWKVTRRMPGVGGVAETRVFTSEEEAIRQYEKWLL